VPTQFVPNSLVITERSRCLAVTLYFKMSAEGLLPRDVSWQDLVKTESGKQGHTQSYCEFCNIMCQSIAVLASPWPDWAWCSHLSFLFALLKRTTFYKITLATTRTCALATVTGYTRAKGWSQDSNMLWTDMWSPSFSILPNTIATLTLFLSFSLIIMQSLTYFLPLPSHVYLWTFLGVKKF
jgi:hypothetical protein